MQLDVEKLKATDDAIKTRVDVQIRKIDRDTSALNDQLRTLRNIQARQPD